MPASDFVSAAPGRRTVLAVITAAPVALTACGSNKPTGDNSPSGSSPSGGSPSGDAVTVAASSVPVGGGLILTSDKIVVTQPTAGTFKAFSAVCTHRGCLVGRVNEGSIVCPCHASQFSITDGAVIGGPAPGPLPPKTVTNSGGTLTIS